MFVSQRHLLALAAASAALVIGMACVSEVDHARQQQMYQEQQAQYARQQEVATLITRLRNEEMSHAEQERVRTRLRYLRDNYPADYAAAGGNNAGDVISGGSNDNLSN